MIPNIEQLNLFGNIAKLVSGSFVLSHHTPTFYIILSTFQLAAYSPPAPGNITTGFPYLRWQQTANYGVVPNDKMPNTFMAVAMDLPDFHSPFGS